MPVSTVDLGVNCWPISGSSEVCLLGRPVPSNGEKAQSEALSFLNWGRLCFSSFYFFSVIFRNILQRKPGNSPSFLSIKLYEMNYTDTLIFSLILEYIVIKKIHTNKMVKSFKKCSGLSKRS